MNRIIVLALVILIGIPAHAWFEQKLIDAVELKPIIVHIEPRKTLTLDQRMCRKHYQNLQLDKFLACRMNRRDI